MKEEQREADDRDEWSAIDDIICFFVSSESEGNGEFMRMDKKKIWSHFWVEELQSSLTTVMKLYGLC